MPLTSGSYSGDHRPPDHHVDPLVYLLAGLLPLVLIIMVTLPVGIAVLWEHRDQPPVGAAPQTAVDGSASGGDPYFPRSGNGGYDVIKYTIDLNWNPADQRLQARTVLAVVATQTLRSFVVDLALDVDDVEVNDRPARFSREGFSDVRIVPEQPLAAGSSFEVAIDYSGKPGDIDQGSITGWYATGQEWTAAGEPQSAAWWFPSDDHPADPALMDVSIRVPAGMEAISNGRLESADAANEADFDTWHWVSRQPMATYLAFISIGQYQLDRGIADGHPYLSAVSEQIPVAQRQRLIQTLRSTPQIIASLQERFGPYPFSEIGGVVPVHDLEFSGLETQTRPVYDAADLLRPGAARSLMVHELSHMWFGDSVTLRHWDDIFVNEAYASWSAWADTEQRGGPSANEMLERTYRQTADHPEFWKITMIDPGKDHLFDAVYTRGPMTLQALRNIIGDQVFSELTRTWAQTPGTRSLEDWMTLAQSRTTIDLQPFFDVWIYGTTVPDRTAANGFR